jgi:tRNA(Ile)-lysidine synthase
MEAARWFAAEGAARGECNLPDGVVVRGVDDRLHVQRFSRKRGQGRPFRPVSASPGFAYPIPGPGRFTIREAGVTMIFSQRDTSPEEDICRTGHRTAFFDMNKLGFPLTVRSFCPGDRLIPMGLNGTQKVKKIFSDRKIAREERHHFPLLLHGDQILWVVGLRQSEIGKIDPTTRQWLKVEAAGCLF